METENSESTVFCGTSEVIHYKEKQLNDNRLDTKLFKIELPHYYHIIDVLIKTLTPLEEARAQRYYHKKDAHRFIICRALLKILIAREKGFEFSQIYFKKDKHYKPYLPIDRSLHFNVSHAGDFAIIAISKYDLGVDIEQIKHNFDYSDILSTVFSISEIHFICNSNHKTYSFYKLWTRKEAIVKAIGKGIDEDFLNIPVTDGRHTILTSKLNNFKKINVFSFNLNNEYIGAVSTTEDNSSIKVIHFCPIPNAEELLTLLSK